MSLPAPAVRDLDTAVNICMVLDITDVQFR